MHHPGKRRTANWLYHTLWTALDWVIPPNCGGCDTTGERWCAACHAAIHQIGAQVCPICGEPQHTAEVCQRCQTAPPEFTQLRSVAVYEGVLGRAMRRLKYKSDVGLGEALAKYLIDACQRSDWQVDLITAVPIGAQRKRERGYNQVGLLARPLSYAVSVPYQPGALQKCRDIRTQVGLNLQERIQNVEGAFLAQPPLVRGKSVLVIDDVTTTGATIRACAQALRRAGATAVYGLTLARAASPQADADDLPNSPD